MGPIPEQLNRSSEMLSGASGCSCLFCLCFALLGIFYCEAPWGQCWVQIPEVLEWEASTWYDWKNLAEFLCLIFCNCIFLLDQILIGSAQVMAVMGGFIL